MKNWKRGAALALSLILALSVCVTGASAKTSPLGQTVGTVLFYVRNSAGEDILISQITVAEMEEDLQAGKVDTTLHNYSLLDRYVTTLHQEAQGFTVMEFVNYAQSKSGLEGLRSLKLTFAGEDKIAFWEIDQSGFDEMDTYSYQTLYGTPRYNFPLLYEYWDYRTQDYLDPAGEMSREETIDYIFDHGEPEIFLLSVRAFSQRYMITDDKYGTGDYSMENYWNSCGLLDNERTVRMMKPMTEDELRNKVSTAADTRYWVANILLDMEKNPEIESLGTVAAPTAVMTEDEDTYYITFQCETPGATVLYNHNYISPSYTPTCEYDGEPVEIPKSWFPGGTVDMTCRAVKEGWADAGVVSLTLAASGEAVSWTNPYTDITEDDWCYEYVRAVTEQGLFDSSGTDRFDPESPMTRAAMTQALYRLAGQPKAAGIISTPLTDVPASASYADAAAWAYLNGIVLGDGTGAFRPDDPVTREQMVTIFHRFAAQSGKADMTPSSPLAKFLDADAVESWAVEPMQWAVGAGLAVGTETEELQPQSETTRGEAAALVVRLAGMME